MGHPYLVLKNEQPPTPLTFQSILGVWLALGSLAEILFGEAAILEK